MKAYADLFHIAAGRRLGCDAFVTFDAKQAAMGKAAGLTVKPVRSRGGRLSGGTFVYAMVLTEGSQRSSVLK